MSDQTVGGVQDRVGRAVIVFEANDFRVGEETLELKDVGRFRSAPAIDRLIVIADHADMKRCAHELLQQAHLERVGVLELVDRHACEALAELLADIIVFAQDFLGEQEQIVEIDRILRAEFVLIGDCQRGEKVIIEIGGIEPFVFCAGDRAEHRLGLDLFIAAAFANQQLFHHADLVRVRADREILFVAELVDATAEDPDAERVEGADGHFRRCFF